MNTKTNNSPCLLARFGFHSGTLAETIMQALIYLLNTQKYFLNLSSYHVCLQQSILNFGLDHHLYCHLLHKDNQDLFTQEIKKTVMTFEHRLTDINVEIISNKKQHDDTTLYLKISGKISQDPANQMFSVSLPLLPEKQFTLLNNKEKHGK